MSGFAGIFTSTPDPAHRDECDRMTERMRHHVACVSGGHEFADAGALAGWVRTGDFRGPVPVWNADRTVCLLFLGEAFTPGPPAPLGASRALGRASAILASYLEGGPAFVLQLNGQFCGLLVDGRRNTATLFNDRFGLGRVYYHETAQTLRFATEAKALLATLPATREIDPRGLAEFIRVGCVLQNRTLFKGVSLLPPGSAWTFHRDGRLEKRRYFDPATWERQPMLGAADYTEALPPVFAEALRRQSVDSRDVGLSLTGGLDSRAVIAWADLAPETPCYTFGGPIRDCADVRIARRLAALCSHPHTTIRIADDFFADFDALAERVVNVSDGTMDVSGAVELHVNRCASGIAPVRLTGNYGSEILRSHVAFRPATLDLRWFTPEFRTRLDEASDTYATEARGDVLTFIATKQVPWHHHARRAVECAELTPRSPFLDNELVALAFRAPPELRGSAQPMLDLIAAGNPALAAVDTDRALRAGSPSPFNRVAAKWQDLTVKAEYAYDYGMPHWLARADRMLTPLHLERLFLGRHKFYHFRLWYREQLGRYVREHALGAANAPYGYQPDALRTFAAEHLAARANHTLSLHRALTVQLIEHLFLRQK